MSAGRAVGVVHRTLGSVLWVVFAVWFASGIVMTFAGFPSIARDERERRAFELRADQIRISPAAARLGDIPPDDVEIVSLGARALYRATSRGQLSAVYADTGESFAGLSETEGAALASAWAGHAWRAVERLDDVDQWTPQAGGHLPLLHLSADDAAATEVYVALAHAEIVQQTTRRTRSLAWVGAIPHWIYPIQLRRHARAWRVLVIALSALGAVASATGIAQGLRALRLRRRSARGGPLALSPFRDRWLRWHHLTGLAFGLLACTWVVSGMFSLVPFGDASRSSPTLEDVRAFRGTPMDLRRFTRDASTAIATCARDGDAPVTRVALTIVGDVPFYVCRFSSERTRVVRAHSASPSVSAERIELDLVARAARALGGGAVVEAEEWLTESDEYYYPTHFEPELALPVLRTRFANGLVTYASPATGTVERRFTAAARAHRWVYHGLHSLDVPALYRRRATWHVVIVVLAGAGALLALTGSFVAVRGRRGLERSRGTSRQIVRVRRSRRWRILRWLARPASHGKSEL